MWMAASSAITIIRVSIKSVQLNRTTSCKLSRETKCAWCRGSLNWSRDSHREPKNMPRCFNFDGQRGARTPRRKRGNNWRAIELTTMSLPSGAPDAASPLPRDPSPRPRGGTRQGRGWAEFNLAVTPPRQRDRYIVTASAELRLVSATLTSPATRRKERKPLNQIPLPERRLTCRDAAGKHGESQLGEMRDGQIPRMFFYVRGENVDLALDPTAETSVYPIPALDLAEKVTSPYCPPRFCRLRIFLRRSRAFYGLKNLTAFVS